MTKFRTTMLAVGATLGLAAAGVAGAATNATHPAATQATCDALLKQADSALTMHKTDPRSKAAQEHRQQGEAACKAGNYEKGAEHLRTALAKLGMKPVN